MSVGFRPAALEQGLAFLDAVPDLHLSEVVSLPGGTLVQRAAGLVRWRSALLRGTEPPPGEWPPQSIAGPVLEALRELGLFRFCRDQADLVDALLRDIFAAFRRQANLREVDVLNRLRELEQLERIWRAEAEEDRARAERREPRSITLDEGTLARLRERAARDIADKRHAADQQLIDSWQERARSWAEIADVFGDLGNLLGRGWDLSIGVLRHTGWSDVLRLRALVAKLPALRDVVRALGRLHATLEGESVADRVFVPVRRVEEERREVPTPHVPAEVRGVERSGDIARMLPAEAVLLGHPKLRTLWHARRAERALLAYRVEGTEIEITRVEREVQEEVDRPRPRPERGPILALVDTSGSMHGLPEQVAKALVLEAARVAHAEKRRCFLYAFSGPGQVLEHELSVTEEGMASLLGFLASSFGGGTDVGEVLGLALERLRTAAWSKADLILLSDGEWPTPTTLLGQVAKARESGTRFHGVLIGNHGATGMQSVCDPVHVFADWATAGGWRRP